MLHRRRDPGAFHRTVGSTGDVASAEDIAEAAKIVLTQPNHLNVTYELVGTLPLSHMAVAEIIGQVLKRKVQAESEEIRAWKLRASTVLATNARSAQHEEYVIENLVKMFDYYDRWGLVGNPNVLRWLLGREPISLESFIKRVVKERGFIQ